MRKELLDILVDMKRKEYDFLSCIIDNAARYNLFISSPITVNKITSTLNITTPTYYKRLRMLIDKKIITKIRDGLYEINYKWITLFMDGSELDNKVIKRRK